MISIHWKKNQKEWTWFI